MVKLYVIDTCRIETPHTILIPRARRLFGLAMYLLLERGKPIARRRLMALFWADRSEAAAQHPLREALRKLRRVGIPVSGDDATGSVLLPKEPVCVDVDGLAKVDVSELLTQEYTILPGYDPGLSAAHSDWLDETRRHLQTKTVARLTDVLERMRLSADWASALSMAGRILDLSPDSARAQEVSRHARQFLQDRMLQGVSHHSPLRVPSVHDRPHAPSIDLPKEGYRASRDTTLVGRTDDLCVLTTALRYAVDGSGRGIYLHGPPGIGKSRLVRELANIGKIDGVAMRRTSCQPHDRHRPLSVFVDIVPSLRKLPGAQGCYPHTSEYLDRLTRHDAATTTPKLEAHEVEYLYEQIRQALFDLVEAVAHEQPLLFVVENVQWSDPRSWALLRDMAARCASQTVLFVFTSREPWQEEWGPCPDYMANHSLTQLSMDASLEHAREYIGALGRSVEADFAGWCARVGEGNPYYTEEIVNNWASTGEQFCAPQSLQALTDKRLQGLNETALRVLQTCAVLSKNSTYERLRAVLQYPDYVFLSAIEELGGVGMLITTQEAAGDGVSRVLCRHEVLADRALRCLSEQGLQLLHYRAGTVLESELQTLDSASLLWDCAQHWNAAGNTEKAIRLGLACGAHLSDVGLTMDAVDVCKKTLTFCSRPEERLNILTAYIKILHLTCEWTDVSRLSEEIHLLRETLGQDPDPHDDLELIQFNADWNLNRNWNQVIERAMRCVNTLSARLNHRVEAGLVILKIGTNMGETDLMHRVYKLLSPAIAAEGIDDDILRLTFEMVYHAICGNPDICISISQQLLDIARTQFKGTPLIRHILNCASGFRRIGYKERGDTLYAEAFHLATAEGAYALAGIAAQQLVLSELDEGNIKSAKEWASRFEQLNRPMEERWGQRTFMISAIQIALESTEFALADHLFATYTESFLKNSTVAAHAKFLAIGIRLRIAQHADPAHVGTLSDELYAMHIALRGTGLQDFLTFSLYLGMAYSGRIKQGQTLLSEYVAVFRRDRSPIPISIHNALQIN